MALALIVLYACSAYLRNQTWREVPHLWADVVKKSPKNERGYLNLCQYYSARKDFTKALFYCDSAITLDPHGKNYLIADAYINRGSVYSDLGQYDRALDDYLKAVSLSPRNSKVFNNIGNVYAKKREYVSAIENYNRSLMLNPRYALAYFNRGYCRLISKQTASALEDFSASITLNPDNADPYAGRAGAFLSMGDKDLALGDLKRCCAMGNGRCCELITQLVDRK